MSRRATQPRQLKVVVVRKQASPDRYAEFVRLLALLLDKPDTPEDGGRP